jgi:hypothetical protein
MFFIIALIGLALLGGCFDGGGRGGGSGTEELAPEEATTLSVADAGEQDADGVAIHLGDTVTTEGIVTVAAGALANNKLKVFIQDGPEGLMVYHQSSADVDAFQVGDRIRVTGVVSQDDPSGDNPATGTARIDISAGSWEVLSAGHDLPLPEPVTLAQLTAGGNAYEGTLVTVLDVHKTAGDWPVIGDKSTSVTVSDGTAQLTLRFQKNTIDAELADKLAEIGDAPFHLTGIVVQNDTNGDGDLLDGFEVWARGAEDITLPIELLREEDASGDALLLGETVTAEGIVTVNDGVLFEAKFEVFIQDSTGGLMLLHDNAAALGVSVSPGDLVRVTGVVAQTDTSGQPLNGSVRIDLNSGGTLEVLGTGHALPDPQVITLAEYLANPASYEGELIRIIGASKTVGTWPAVGVKGTITISDDGGVTTAKLQIQKGANTADLTGTTNPFDVVGLAIQNDTNADGDLLDGFEIWIRSPADINP